ncbi:allophanate hydrolase [Terrilactibacillus sp. BCM23-1]|uniref:Allophanate hydrolase n=1 Tax=Terrilactibacillus tamarindi TaxID=2599694 RepID=A0A6N8CSP0_9BACI|nr:allophanate hydrolase [Terrilactibacillus tamarindi]MTT32217.1 allophanate hydrolase [Terrilactibacillus tamarindi]
MKTTHIPDVLSVQSLREMYLKKELTPKEVIEVIIQRSKQDEPMNIWITPPDLAFIQPYLDGLSNIDIEQAPLWGIPFAIKDNIDLAGIPTTAGCPDYAFTPSEHATVVKHLIEAGAIPVGKTNLDQFATGLVGTRSPYGETHNALKDEMISGGSSAGSPVAVARGQAAFSLGTDTAGSGRVPAALNRLVGFKPSLGAWSTKGVVPACASLDCVTVFSHNIEDAKIVDQVVRKYDDQNPWSKDIPKPSPKLPKKVCLPKSPLRFFGPYGNQYKEAWDKSLERIKSWGLPIEWIDNQLFSNVAKLLYEGPFVAERWADLGTFVDSHPGSTFPVTEKVLKSGANETFTASLLFDTMHKLKQYQLQVKKRLSDAVFITPTAGGTWSREQVRKDPIQTNSDMGEYTNHCNLLDLCAISVPFEDAAKDIPFGVTFFALSEHEDFILGLAEKSQAHSTRIKESPAYKELATTNDSVLLAVCGLHMRGLPLEHQLNEHRATFIYKTETAKKYRMFKLPTNPPKPGLIKTEQEGSSIQVELWECPTETFGAFVAAIPAPLGIGKIELKDGSEVQGFICEPYATEEAEDISNLGGWREYLGQPMNFI